MKKISQSTLYISLAQTFFLMWGAYYRVFDLQADNNPFSFISSTFTDAPLLSWKESSISRCINHLDYRQKIISLHTEICLVLYLSVPGIE